MPSQARSSPSLPDWPSATDEHDVFGGCLRSRICEHSSIHRHDQGSFVFGSSPTQLRAVKRGATPSTTNKVTLRLPFRTPMDAPALFAFLGARSVKGVEERVGESYRRTLKLPHSAGFVELEAGANFVWCRLRLGDVRDLAAAVCRCRLLLDLDADPVAVDSTLGGDPLLGPLVRRAPGLRVPGTVDGAELAVRAVIGQQISVAGARTIAGRLVAGFGTPLTVSSGGMTHVWPDVEVLAEADLAKIGLPRKRQATIRSLSTALAEGDIVIDPGADRIETRAKLVELPGIGPWTASYIAMRALGDPDEFTATDLGVRRALERLGSSEDFESIARRWKPWRAYAQQHLWKSLGE
ncbi:MAG: DNA-3-methyladenine glycosylase family protein [Actinomycetota bacterium]